MKYNCYHMVKNVSRGKIFKTKPIENMPNPLTGLGHDPEILLL